MRTDLKILNASSALYNFSAGLIGPFYAVFVDEIGGGAVLAGTSFSVYAIAAGILIYLMSRWEDRQDRVDVIVAVGHLFQFLGYTGYLFVARPWHLIVVQALLGLGSAIKSPAFDDLYSRLMHEGRFAREWGVWESMYWIVTGLAAAIAGVIIHRFGFQALFMLMSAVSFTALCISLWLVRREAWQPT